jgi:type IV pilus assembly protein PilF
MFQIKFLFLLFISYFLLSCSSTPKSSNEKMSENQNIETAKINTQLGIAYLDQGNVFRAKQKLLLALDEAPQIPETWYSMAYFYETTGNNKLANKYYLKSVEIAPKRGDVQNNYGTYLCRVGDYKESIQHFLLAAQDTNYLDTASAYENAGLCALKIPNRHQAIAYFKRAIAEDPNRTMAVNELAKLEHIRNKNV